MNILAIETSCDETACAVVSEKSGHFCILGNAISSQIKLHSQWGGVVPNLAAREHLKNILPIIKKGFHQAKIRPDAIDLIAVTNGPGLIPALLVGTTAAKTLAYLWKKPLIGVHHIEGHIYANFIENKIGVNSNIQFPILCLVVSGGHTQLVLMKKHLSYEIVGETLDDAAGEAFDKVARILGLGYPGGPAIAACAANFKFPISNFQKNSKIKIPKTKYLAQLPRPMINSSDLNFSFSGLKTAVLYSVKKNEELLKDKKFVGAVCQEFQQAVVDVLITKTLKAAKIYKPKTIFIAGGVSANQELRRQLGEAINKNLKNTKYNIPNAKYSLDNAAMIAIAAAFRWKISKNRKIFSSNWKKLKTDANLKL